MNSHRIPTAPRTLVRRSVAAQLMAEVAVVRACFKRHAPAGENWSW